MGYAHVLWVYDDALRQEGIDSDLGAAILKVCSNPDFESTAEGKKFIRDVPVRAHGNAVNWVDDPYSSDERVYFWSENCLRRITELEERHLERIRSLVEAELSSRSG